MDFSLMFFSGGEGRSTIGSYDDIREIAGFGDQHGFRRIWLPERHFQSFGALHPNPSVLAAYLAASTDTIRIAAGSVVAPLHDPLRIAEEWSVVDNLSRGRIDVALASGWLKSDFVFAPDAYEDRHRLLGDRVRELRSLWRGGRAERRCGGGDRASVRVYPTAVQPELPLWVTAARNPETFRLAGALGANVLTYFVDLGLEGLANAIGLYRAARREAGLDPATGVVTVMLHAFVGEDSAATYRRVAQPYREYLLRNSDLLHQGGRNNALLTPRNLAELADAQLTRVYEKLSLLGSVEAGLATAARLGEIGVNEIACLVDFIDDMAMVKEALPMLAVLKERAERRPTASPTPARAPDAARQADADDFYAYIRSIGGEYGEKFRLIERVSLRGSKAISDMRAPAAGRGADAILVDAIISTGHAFGLRPGLRGSSMPLALPAEVGSITIGALGADGFRVETSAKGRRGNLEYFDAVATAPDGDVVARITDFAFQRLMLPPNDERIRLAADAVFIPGWTRLPIAGSQSHDKRFTLTAPTPQLAEAWTAALSGQGLNVATASASDSGLAGTDHILLAHEPGPWRMGDAASPRTGVARIASWVADLRSRAPGARLVILVSGANAVPGGSSLPNPIAAAAWAAGGSMSLDGGEVRVIDLDPSRSIEEMAGGLAGLLHTPVPMASVRGEAVYVPGIVRDPKAAGHADRARPAVLADRSVLVTGGTGALGQAVVEWATEEGASNVDIVARHSVAFEQRIERGAIGEIRGSIADPELWTRAEVRQDFDTVFHLAGIDPGAAAGDMAGAIDQAFEPKLDGLLNLRPLLERDRPCHLVLFSSVAALAGSYGQAAYAAANAAMAAAAQHLVAGTSHRATILHFGPWQGGGMAASSALDAVLAAKGVDRIEPWVALRAMGMLLPKAGGSWIVGRFDEGRVQHPAAPLAATDEQHGDGNTLLATFKTLSDADKRELLYTKIRHYAADIMEVAEDEIDLDANLFEMGFDSLMALEMRNALSLDYGIEVGLGVLMDARTLTQVADTILPVIEAAAAGKPVRRDPDMANIDIVL